MKNFQNEMKHDGNVMGIPGEEQLLASGLVEAIEKSNGRIHVMLSSDGLAAVSLAIAERIRNQEREQEESMSKPKRNEDMLISKKQARDMLGVCDTTLWAWAQKGYLKVHKVGNRAKYRLGDILNLVEASK